MSVDYRLVLADLASKRAAACALFDSVSQGLQLLVRDIPAPAEVAPPQKLIAPAKAKKPAPKAAKPASRPESPLAWKAIAERDGLRAACTASGIPYATLWARAKAQGWKVARRQGQHAKPKPSTVRAVRPAPPIAASTAKTPIAKTRGKAPQSNCELRRCAHCEQYTTMDPCERCHQPWQRTEG